MYVMYVCNVCIVVFYCLHPLVVQVVVEGFCLHSLAVQALLKAGADVAAKTNRQTT